MLMKASMIVHNCGPFSLTVTRFSGVTMSNRLPGSSMMRAAASHC